MKIVYYSVPPYIDLSLMFVKEISKLVDLHFILEIAPESRKSSLLDVTGKTLPEGISDASPLLNDCFPKNVQKYWQDCASFSLLVHNCAKSIHPASWRISNMAASFISKINPDIVHLEEVSLRQTWFLSRLTDMPFVLSIHDPESHTGEKNWRRDFARYLSFPKMDKFLLHNSNQAGSFMKKYKLQQDRVCTVPLGVYGIYREWEREEKQDEKTILFFGRISPYKGLDVLFRAAPSIAEKVPGIRIIVAGRPIAGYSMPALPDLAGKGTIDIISEHISNSQLAVLFNRSTVVVCPYIDATQSGVVLTSYAFTKPVVATDAGGMSEYVRHMQTGLLVEAGNEHQLAEALVRVISDRELQAQFKSGIKDLVTEELCWENIARQTCGVYSEVSKLK